MSFVKLFYTDASKYYDPVKLAWYIGRVDTERRERIERAKNPETKAGLLVSGLIVPKTLKTVFGRDDFVLEKDEWGKPYVANADGIYFNIARAGKFVACAVSDIPVGVDIEEISAQEGFINIADTFFSVMERNAIMMSPSPEEAFCRLWTLRESYVKMCGTGFDRGLAPLSCSFPGGTPKINVDGKLREDVFFTEIRDIYLCRGAVCTLGAAEYSSEKIEV